MVVKPVLDRAADTSSAAPDEQLAPTIAPLQPQVSGHSDMAQQIREAIHSRSSHHEDDDYTIISLPSEHLRNEDSDSDWDASDREDAGPNALPSPLRPRIKRKPVNLAAQTPPNQPVPANLPDSLKIGPPSRSASPAGSHTAHADNLVDPTQKLNINSQATSAPSTSPPKDRVQTNPFLRQMSFGADAPEVVVKPGGAGSAVDSYWQSQTFDGTAAYPSAPRNQPHVPFVAASLPAAPVHSSQPRQQLDHISTQPATGSPHQQSVSDKSSTPLAPSVAAAPSVPAAPPVPAPPPIPAVLAVPAVPAVPAAPPVPAVPAVPQVSAAPPPPPPPPAVAPPPAAGASSSAAQSPETPQQLLQKQQNAVYSIKKITWRKSQIAPDLLESPILVQNANGPCPLLALVNALVLSTRPGQESGLISTLRTREQISLGLLIDAVFDELISGDRPSGAPSLPDLSELYRFLVNLHTGMNVNPRFVPKDGLSSKGIVPGTFEETAEMRLYSTFGLPLVHGWIPGPEDPAYAAFQRSAPSYEDTQNLLFLEDELESKWSTGRLSSKEQNQFMDLTAIKEFMAHWSTQLSSRGLDVMREHLKPGRVAILFRNDHFSTIYKEPITDRLYALVTDAGYAPHAEIVFESLVDASGAQTSFYSGAYEPVDEVDGQRRAANGNATAPPPATASRTAREGASGASAARPPTTSAPANTQHYANISTEQEDADLALAMQLQEEEEERQRTEQAQRRREEELSRQYLSQDSHEQRPRVPPRHGSLIAGAAAAGAGGSTNNNNNNSSMPSSRPAPAAGPGAGGGTGETQLPSYEQAAASQPFHPPAGHPANANAPRRNTSEEQPGARPSYQPGPSNMRPYGYSGHYATTHQATRERHEGCAIM